jgi:hypothetical protein
VKATILSVVLLASLSTSASEIGMGVLMIWPTARSTALAGAMTGLADEADATYFNPAGLAFQSSARAAVNYCNWLPGLNEGMSHAFAACGAPVRLPFLRDRSAFLAGSLTYMVVGETDIVNERGEYLGRTSVWRGAAAVSVAVPLATALGAGISLKVARSAHTTLGYDWIWPPGILFDPQPTVTATIAAADVGASYRPSQHVTFGMAVTNVGPGILYRRDGWENTSYTADLPRAARLGLHWTAMENRLVRLGVMPELTKVLVGMFQDTTETFNRRLGEELRDMWKAVGIEATVLDIISLRLGYFEDLTDQRGGLVFEKESSTYHYGVGDVLAGRKMGRFKSIGLTWGFGIGYKDYFRFDVSSDAAIYDFPTENWKFQLTCNDLGRLFRKGRA